MVVRQGLQVFLPVVKTGMRAEPVAALIVAILIGHQIKEFMQTIGIETGAPSQINAKPVCGQFVLTRVGQRQDQVALQQDILKDWSGVARQQGDQDKCASGPIYLTQPVLLGYVPDFMADNPGNRIP